MMYTSRLALSIFLTLRILYTLQSGIVRNVLLRIFKVTRYHRRGLSNLRKRSSQQPDKKSSQQPVSVLVAYVENKRYLAFLSKIVTLFAS